MSLSLGGLVPFTRAQATPRELTPGKLQWESGKLTSKCCPKVEAKDEARRLACGALDGDVGAKIKLIHWGVRLRVDSFLKDKFLRKRWHERLYFFSIKDPR